MPNLKNGRVYFLVVILLPCVFPWNSEHGATLILPLQSGVLPALDLLHQPLLQPATSRVGHLNGEKLILNFLLVPKWRGYNYDVIGLCWTTFFDMKVNALTVSWTVPVSDILRRWWMSASQIWSSGFSFCLTHANRFDCAASYEWSSSEMIWRRRLDADQWGAFEAR